MKVFKNKKAEKKYISEVRTILKKKWVESKKKKIVKKKKKKKDDAVVLSVNLSELIDGTHQFQAYEEAYDILMDYFDELSPESRKEIDIKLKKLGL